VRKEILASGDTQAVIPIAARRNELKERRRLDRLGPGLDVFGRDFSISQLYNDAASHPN
jgi:hypothetical protein